MKRNIIFLSIVFIMIYLAGCKQIDNENQNSQVVIHLTAKSLSGTLSSTASSVENSISKVILFGVDDQDKVVQTFAPIQKPSLKDTALYVSQKVSMLYAIANPSESLAKATPSTGLDIMNLIDDFTTAPEAPFLMGGKGEIKNFSVTIELIRAVAKIEVKGKNDFQITSVTVENTSDRGYVFKQKSLSLPAFTQSVKYAAVISATPTLYVAESLAQNPASFVVKGTLEGKQASYTFTLLSEGKKIDLVRNTHYQISITPITHDDCIITVKIPTWDDGEKLDDQIIPDNAFNP